MGGSSEYFDEIINAVLILTRETSDMFLDLIKMIMSDFCQALFK